MTFRLLVPSCIGFAAAVTWSFNASAQTIKADHTTVDVRAISEADLAATRMLRMSLSHASVGGNVWSGLEALAQDEDFAFPNWRSNDRGNPGWQAKIAEFESWVGAHANEYDIFQNKFCYIDQDADFATYRDSMNRLASTYPDKTFVWWTMPIMTDDGDNVKRQAFNRQVREYCATNSRVLYDIADIESHTPIGTKVTSSGVEALDPNQSSDGGHLSTLGASRAAQAQWVLMAKIGGANVASPARTATDAETATNAEAKGSDGGDAGCAIVTPRSTRTSRLVLLLAALGILRRRTR